MAERNVRRDSADHLYSEFYMSKDERIRVTFRENADWADGRALRVRGSAAREENAAATCRRSI